MNEKITLSNGDVETIPLEENSEYKFYLCGTNPVAADVAHTLTLLGNNAVVDFNSRYGWFVRVKK